MANLPQRKLSQDEVFANLKGGDRVPVLRTPQDEPDPARRNGTTSLQTLAAAVAENLPAGLPGPNAAKSLLKEFRFFRAVDRDADSGGGACFETDIDYATCCTFTVAKIEFYRENDGEPFRQQHLLCVYDDSPEPAGYAYVDGSFTGARNPSKFIKAAPVESTGYTDAQIDSFLAVKLGTPLAAELATVQQELAGQTDEYGPGRLYGIAGNWNATGTTTTVYVVALQPNLFSPHGILRATNGTLSVVSVNVPAGTTTPVASYTVQQQHALQLATLGVQASPAMAYLASGDVDGFATLAEALADPRPKTFMRFNVATVTLNASNDPQNPGWASYVDGAGATLELGDNVVLSLPGSDLGSLLFKNFFIFPVPGTRSGKLKLLATGNTNTPPGLLPLFDGQCSVPLELAGGAVALRGSFVSLLGTGTVHLFEPYDYGYVSPGITLVEHKAGAGGAGTVKSVFNVSPDAAGDVSPPALDVYNVPQAVRDAVAGGTFSSGELQGAQPDGSLPGQKFTSATYGYEYQRGAAGGLVWCRYPKG